MDQSNQLNKRDTLLDEIDTRGSQNQSDSLQKGVNFTGVDSVYILPKQNVSDMNGSITSDISDFHNNNKNRNKTEQLRPPENVDTDNKMMAVPAYVIGDDDTVTLGYVIDLKSQHMNLLDDNLLKELDLYAEKLLEVINEDGHRFFALNQTVSNKVSLSTVNNPFQIDAHRLSNKTEHSVKSSIPAGIEVLSSGKMYNVIPQTRDIYQMEGLGVDSSSFETYKSPILNKAHPRRTLRENILRKFEHKNCHESNDCKKLKVSAKWTLCKQEQISKTKNPVFTMNGVATVGGQEVKSTVHFHLDDDVLLNLIQFCNKAK